MFESIPLKVYQTFVLKESFGFNKQSYLSFSADEIKTFAISSCFLIPATIAFFYSVDKGGDKIALYLGIGALCFRFLLVTAYPVFIFPLFVKLSPLKDDEYRNSISALSTRLSFPLSKLNVADGSSRSTHSNALFYGFPWQRTLSCTTLYCSK